MVIPNGVEIPHVAESQDALRTFGLERKKYLLAVGRLVPEKGFHDLIEAFGRLHPAIGPRPSAGGPTGLLQRAGGRDVAPRSGGAWGAAGLPAGLQG